MPLAAGQVLSARYRIVKLLGQGGFGAVYRAWDANLNRPCAIKENLDETPDTQRQFAREAQVLADLHHPNLVGVKDFLTLPGQGQYLVMDFIDGEDLDCLLERQGKVDPQTALGWIVKICGALEYLHAQTPPIYHRDIKPANIRLNPKGEPVLVDFGLVKVFTAGQKTTVGARAVTPGYSPPEQYGHGNTDARSDLYALAATLYALLAGSPPEESIQRIGDPRLAPVPLANPAAAGQLDVVLAKALEINAAQRYQTATELAQALRNLMTALRQKPPVLQKQAQGVNVSVQQKKSVVVPLQPPVNSTVVSKATNKQNQDIGCLAISAGVCFFGLIWAVSSARDASLTITLSIVFCMLSLFFVLAVKRLG